MGTFPNKQTRQETQKMRVQRTEAYAQRVKREYEQAVNSILALKKSVPDLPTGQMYSFDGDTKRVQRQVNTILRQLHSATLTTIKTGVETEWGQANKEVDSLLRSALGKKALSNPDLAGWFSRNEEAMDAFLTRHTDGMTLSNRVWKNTRQFRDEMEVAMTVAIGEGQSASQMSRRVRQYLNDPDLMFRRFRYKDDDGNWQRKWKKRVKTADGRYKFIDYDRNDYKVGAGMYKSSYRNAMRLTRTETNMAYRRADHDRWQTLDFVRGQHIETSRTHDERGKEAKDICDQLAGDYPREFVFDGWHPQCMCMCTAIMVSEEEMIARMQARLRGESYEFKEKPITDYPKGFRDFVKNNRQNIIDAQKRGKQPYFIKYNADAVNGILKEEVVADAAAGDASIVTAQGAPMSDKELREKVKETFAKVGETIDEKDIVIEDGHVRLSAYQARKLSKFQSITDEDRKLIYDNYIATGESFYINDFCRADNKGEYNPIQDDFRIAKDRYSKLSNDQIKTIEALDRTIANNSLPFPVRVVRYIECNLLENACGLSTKFHHHADVQDVADKISNMSTSNTYVDAGFNSFSFDAAKNGMTGRAVELTIDIPAGTPMFISNNISESEGILGRNVPMNILKTEKYTFRSPYPGISPKEKLKVHLKVRR